MHLHHTVMEIVVPNTKEKDMKRLDIPAVDPIERAAQLLIDYANEVGGKVVAEMNDVDVFAYPGDTVEKVMAQYRRKRQSVRLLEQKKKETK